MPSGGARPGAGQKALSFKVQAFVEKRFHELVAIELKQALIELEDRYFDVETLRRDEAAVRAIGGSKEATPLRERAWVRRQALRDHELFLETRGKKGVKNEALEAFSTHSAPLRGKAPPRILSRRLTNEMKSRVHEQICDEVKKLFGVAKCTPLMVRRILRKFREM
jgi:hypothetical protein